MMSVKRGDIYYADLSPVVGSEQGGLRPVPFASAAETNGAKSEINRDVIAKIKIRRLRLSLIVVLRIGASFFDQ